MDDAVKKYKARRDARLKKRLDEFNENDHPRDGNGRFASGGGGGSSPKKENKPGKAVGSEKGELKKRQAEAIKKMNPPRDDYHTWIRGEEDIKTFDEVSEEMEGITPDVTKKVVDDAKRTGKIKVYSSHDIKGGTFVTPSKMLAKDYAGGGSVKEMEVPLEHVAWIDGEQGQYVGDLGKNKAESSGEKKGPGPKNKEKFDVATKRLAYTDSDSRAQSIIADAMEDSDFSKADTEKLADGYCERKGYGKSKAKRFKESVQIRLNEVKKAREKYTNEFLDKVPNYETEHEFVSDMRRMRHWEPINNDSIMRVFDSYCEYHGIKGTKKDKLFKAIGGEKK